MTFSIVATDGNAWGVAVASKFLAVGAVVPAARAGVGAIATQSYANIAYRPDGLALLADGRSAQETLDALTAADEGRDQRQAGIVDGAGRAATFTGPGCHEWAGGVTGDGYAIQGNILTGPDVVAAMEQAWQATDPNAPLGRRLLAALAAGDAAGGDKRGRQSAALLVVTPEGGYGGGSDVYQDLRVDDHRNPVPELSRLIDIHDRLFARADEADMLPVTEELSQEVAGMLRLLGFAPAGEDLMSVGLALADWAGIGEPRGADRAGSQDRPGRSRDVAREGRRGEPMSVLAIDAGTTGVTALVVTDDGRIAFPRLPGVHAALPPARLGRARTGRDLAGDPGRVSRGTRSSTDAAHGHRHHEPARDRGAVGPTEPRGAAASDRVAGPTYRRDLCEQLRDAGHEPRVAELTGLRLDPYFTGTKLAWLAANDPAWAGVTAGDVVDRDGGLLPRRAAHRRASQHATDPSNASRTLLYDIAAGSWSEELCELLNVPMSALPEVRRSSGELGRTDANAFLGLDLPIAGIAGDQQAALFGQACFDDGESKCTYGTGSFILVNTGTTPVRSDAGLLTTVAWDIGDGLVYALEGAIFVTGAAVQWLRDGLGIISSAAETEAVARSVPDSGGVVFVPALTGLGAPHWDPDARGTITGITRGTTRAHLVRATLEAIAFEVRDVVDVMMRDAGIAMPELSVDGGAAANDLLCQLQATELQVPVRRPQVAETTALGAAFLAGLATGVWSSTGRAARRPGDSTSASNPNARDDANYARWQEAIRRTKT